MHVKNEHLSKWAEGVIHNHIGVSVRVPPPTSHFVWGLVNYAPKSTSHPDNSPPAQIRRLSGPKLPTDSGNEEEIEVLTSSSAMGTRAVDEQIPPATGPKPPLIPQSATVAPLIPIPPASPRLESYEMETYLRAALIDQGDTYTRGRLMSLGIHHWVFFRTSSEAELIGLGFPIGVARALVEGVGRLERHDDREYDHEQDYEYIAQRGRHGTPATPSPLI
ncbi:hypothetical protein PTTG_30755 [Puccinia triticina 1-1 BBBD Race 1]|uniref:Uncharacterized protein n=1 Tax=Puccinia triticina (isolate 1-1 / race 1 (BBBD)) TaxID=630390 RepID=A0A180FXI7_PUCT1|nr:hypothetical protein PTTG_30755 [Puccinia triticina 1-1 BBBD Race 1]